MITVIGAGNMGATVAKKLLQENFCTPETLCIVDSHEEKLEYFEKKGCTISTNAHECIPHSEIIILALKPLQIRKIVPEWKNIFPQNLSICSLAAGISVEDLQEMSGIKKIIRIMPNTPLLVNEGICGWFADSSVEKREQQTFQQMINCLGLAIQCESEDKIDSITALSGSGPAYYFYLLEHMQKKAELFGFSPAEAKEIALQTLRGAGELAYQSEESFEKLRKNITSKGGTTEKAIEYFEKKKLGEIWKKGIESAYERAKEL